MMILALEPETSSFFSNLTFPNYAHLLEHFDPEIYLAVGALNAEQVPVGLILVGKSQWKTVPHEILSIYVDEDWRQQGVAKQMLDYLKGLVLASPIPLLKASYPDDLPDVDALEKVFLGQGFRIDPVQLLTIRGAIHIGMELIRDLLPLPEGLTFRDWQDHNEDDTAQMLAYNQHIETTGAHDPFVEVGVPIHAASSVLLCQGERVIGWMLNHEVQPKVIRYTRLFIAPDWRKQGLGVHCFFESMRRQYVLDPHSIAVFAAQSHNSPMMAVIEYFRPHPDVHFSRVKRVLWEGIK